jgi:AAT family amino acid transporter/GABA permease
MIYLMIAVAHIRLRNKSDPATLSIKMWLFPGLSYGIIAAMIGVLAAMTMTRDLLIQLASSGLAFALAVALYVLLRKRGARALSAEASH